ncbi:alpha/beta fold hydrolase [Sphingomonas sp. Leaf38]|uniref:alpha/beta fold hydrolase n=1 Tax=Sphingomonas sp. Leaf38 TaxID=1736217 RepID=UPI000701767A|nr:alpha/beta hydrolase [Sphingomonas sp. Leaf38]KQN28839.1 alpha/beta hydrolase [Sphingomonas sp. Leaf38]
MTGPTLVFLHALGASAREWEHVIDSLPEYACVALDLPGFGGAAGAGHADVATMTDWLADEIRSRRLVRCVVVGHSMGGKIATLVAARAAAGETGLSGVLGVVLVAASPPAPEPMDDDRRAQMIGWFADGQIARDDAATFVDANTVAPLPDPLRASAIDDVLHTSREAWLGWLERGSREDWRAAAGKITIPALIVAGGEDGDLGEDAQRRLNVPHYVTSEVRVVANAAHLIPYERPQALAALIRDHASEVAASALPTAFAQILGSARVSKRTRRVMLERLRPPRDAAPWSDAHHATLAALIAQILPDCGADHRLAQRVAAGVAQGDGDGWRFADLPADNDAWIRGLATLRRMTGGVAAQDTHVSAGLLETVAKGEAGIADDEAYLSPEQMKLWFEDVRAEVVRVWMSLPTTMAAIGYDGFAVGGDAHRKQGYTRTAADDVESWQSAPERAA